LTGAAAPDFDGAAVAESAIASITAAAARPTDAQGKSFLTCTESSSFFEVSPLPRDAKVDANPLCIGREEGGKVSRECG
jgi:hypothetical protein